MPLTHPAPQAQLMALATAVPSNVIEQRSAFDLAERIFGERIPGFAAFSNVFASTGIERRYAAEPLAWFETDHDWTDRSRSYLIAATALFADVVTRVLARANLVAAAIDAVVMVSSTGVATPSIDARVLPQLGFRTDVQRIPIFGLGCAAGVSGTAIASRLAAGEPGTNVLLVNIELCTLAFRSDRATKMDVVSTALFGDGASAAIFRCDESVRGIAHVAGATEHLWADSIDIMGWSTDPTGLGVILSRSLPDFITTHYRTAYDRAYAQLGLDPDQRPATVMHPGGTRVLESIERALEIEPGTLATERAVMRDYGNMSSPTVFFVLERALAAGAHGPLLMAALGPGFTATFVSLDVSRT